MVSLLEVAEEISSIKYIGSVSLPHPICGQFMESFLMEKLCTSEDLHNHSVCI